MVKQFGLGNNRIQIRCRHILGENDNVEFSMLMENYIDVICN